MVKGGWHIVHVYNNESNDGVVVNIIDRIDAQSKEIISQQKKFVNEYFRLQRVFQSVFANRNDLLKSIVDFGDYYLNRVAHPEEIIDHAMFDISRLLANTCSMFRSFLDHSDRHFIKTYGKDSPEHLGLKNVRSKQYDESIGYRVMYHIRNYIQHYDMPLAISVNENSDQEGATLRIDLQIEMLKEDRSFKKSVFDCFDDVREPMPLLHVLNDWSECVNKIWFFENTVRLPSVSDAAKQIINLRNKFKINKEGQLAITFFEGFVEKPETLKLGLDWIPENKANAILDYMAQDAP